jgi:hypothetical protein
MAARCRTALAFAGLLLCGIGGGCREPSAPPTAPSDPPIVTPIEATGLVRIAFVRSNVPPGGSIAGCGPTVAGCAGRMVITLRLQPTSDGPVLYTRVYLHSMRNLVACLTGQTPPFTLRAGQPVDVDVTLDLFDTACGTPETIATMAAVVVGPVEVDSRQTWSTRYTLNP